MFEISGLSQRLEYWNSWERFGCRGWRSWSRQDNQVEEFGTADSRTNNYDNWLRLPTLAPCKSLTTHDSILSCARQFFQVRHLLTNITYVSRTKHCPWIWATVVYFKCLIALLDMFYVPSFWIQLPVYFCQTRPNFFHSRLISSRRMPCSFKMTPPSFGILLLCCNYYMWWCKIIT